VSQDYGFIDLPGGPEIIAVYYQTAGFHVSQLLKAEVNMLSPGFLEHVTGKFLSARAQPQVIARFTVEAAALISIEKCASHDPVDHPGPEIIAAVEVLDRIHYLLAAEPWVLVVGKLMAEFVRHVILGQIPVGLEIFIEFGAGVRVRQ
jgi:hypothetical protein